MENDQPLDNNFSTDDELFLSSEIRSYLKETAKWGNFLAIVGFIFLILIVLGIVGMALFMGSAASAFPGAEQLGSMGIAFVLFFYSLIILIYFFPTLYLYRFSNLMQSALLRNDQTSLMESFGNLKSFYKFFGIFTAVIIGFYALIFLAALVF